MPPTAIIPFRMNKKALFLILAFISSFTTASASDSTACTFSHKPEWHIGVETAPAWVPGTNDFLRGDNPYGQKVNATLSTDIRGGFKFNPSSKKGRLYRGAYQGIGIGVNTFFAGNLLGTPLSAYVYQGAPVARFNKNLWLGYEWQFGIACGWKPYDQQTPENHAPVSTSVTAHMGLGFKIHYEISSRWQLSAGVAARHYSNGNTSWPNRGVNSIGATIGVAYVLNPQEDFHGTLSSVDEEADRQRWKYDLMLFGAWRKRALVINHDPLVLPGKFGIAGMQFSPMLHLNRMVSVGPAIDFMWDESAGLSKYKVDGSYGDNIKFYRPPFGKQISVGASAHAELTMPIFTINAGLGFDFIKPKSERRFYQSLTLKTFVSKNLYLNIGYRLGRFKDPQNLMLGIGLRL